MKRIVLASQSPRRRELMEFLNRPFEVMAPKMDEVFHEDLSIQEQIESIAYDKAKEIFDANNDALVIGADTVVVIGDEILGKPITDASAKAMLKKLSGQTHTVITSVALLSSTREEVFSSITKVEFYPLSDLEIESYVESKEPLDKAGAYTIQAGGAVFVKGIEGDFYTVMGLPIAEIYQRLVSKSW